MHPLELPEICNLVEQYLSRRDLLQCVAVSRLWYEVFSHTIWQSVYLTAESLDLDVLQRHRHSVRTLIIEDILELEGTVPACPNLNFLRLNGNTIDKEYSEEASSKLAGLLSRNTSTCHLILDDVPTDWSIVSERLTDLRNLEVWNSDETTNESLPSFWKTCTRLDALSLSAVHLMDLSNLDDRTIFHTIKTLTLEDIRTLSDHDLLEIPSRCPRLETLHLLTSSIRASRSITQGLIARAAAGAWPHLQSLKYEYDGSEISEPDVVLLLQSMKKHGCIQWEMPAARFRSDAFEALKEHFLTVVHLNLASCRVVTSAMTQQILESCPRLKTYQAGMVHAKDVAEGRPWVCTSLTMLAVFIDTRASIPPRELEEVELEVYEEGGPAVEVEAERLDRAVFQQLSRLPKLKSMLVGWENSRRWFPKLPCRTGLDFRLEKGLDLLAGLNELEELVFSHSDQFMGKAEIQWMLKHWENLQMVRGCLNGGNYQTNKALIHVLRMAGIRVCTGIELV